MIAADAAATPQPDGQQSGQQTLEQVAPRRYAVGRAPPAGGLSWLTQLAIGQSSEGDSSAQAMATAETFADMLRAWASARVPHGERLTRSQLLVRLGDDVAAIDSALSRQVDAILHAPEFQTLESSWRGLAWLVEQAVHANDDAAAAAGVEIRLLSVTKRELAKDRSAAIEFDRSHLWRKVYEDEFGTPGGTPYGLLVTDFAFGHHPDDVSLLGGLSEVAMASFAPLLAAPTAGTLGLESFSELERLPPRAEQESQPEYVKWRALRSRDEARFLGMVLPRVLARRPYDGWLGRAEVEACHEATWSHRGFRYREQADRADGRGRTWMSGVWPLAGVVVREFGRSGWFADIRGGSPGVAGGGLVEDLITETFDGLRADVSRGPTDVYVTDAVERELDDAGFIPLCSTGADGRAVFHGNSTLHSRERYDTAAATANASISSMLQYVLCVSRFAHYLKVIGRDKVGGFQEVSELQRYLSDWLNQYVTPDDQASAETRARMPLRAADVEVREEPGTAGSFRIVMRFQPHFQLDRLDATLKLVTTLRKPGQR